MAVLGFDIPHEIQEALRVSSKSIPRPTTLEQVFAWHCDIIDQLILLFDNAIWTVRDVVRLLEKVCAKS